MSRDCTTTLQPGHREGPCFKKKWKRKKGNCSELLWWAQCIHKSPEERGMNVRDRGSDGVMETERLELPSCWLWRWREGLPTKDDRWPLEARKGKEQAGRGGSSL